MKSIFVACVGLFCVAYLILESFIPVETPIIGNLDEATATTILVSCLYYFGIDFYKLFGKRK